ncbi:MAG TPA: alpha/beta hydrolase domain-containing protein [Alphaproteobacteria bacterium]|nr:alpha/beta hydrolase domain-containing protein [Alphaproteobacteria bacterium]
MRAELSLLGLFAACALSLSAEARITKIVVDTRLSPAYGGKAFGAAGQYEMLSGHAFGELDPKDPLNAIITDIALAPRNAHGMVEYSATFQLIKPIDMAKASGVLTYQVANRGLVFFSGPDEGGHVTLASGWQGDIPAREGMQTISVPVARNPDGSPVTGLAIATFTNMPAAARSLPLVGGIGFSLPPRPEPVSLDTKAAHLTRRSAGGQPMEIAPGDWAFADCASVPFPGTPGPHHLCLKDGFDPAYLYELSYTAKDPLILGIGFAATRDLNAFFRYADKDDTGAPNPIGGKIRWAIAIGGSQSGNFLRSFVNLGFNQAEDRKMVWDGIEPTIAGRQLAMNLRFATPGGAAGIDEPGSEGRLWWADYDDTPRNGQGKGGLLDRCRATKTCPKVFELFGASEFWGLRMSPDLVGTDAKADIPLPGNVRRYYFPGVTHGGGKGGFPTEPGPAAKSITGTCVLADNPNPSSDANRALTAAFIDWVAKGTAPPPSRYPRIASGDLVQPAGAAMGFPAIPGQPRPDGMLNAFLDQDFGAGFVAADLSGTFGKLPPKVRRTLPSLVPKVDADGNETAGVRSVQSLVPLGTYLGWNVTASGFYKGQGCGFSGGYIPFAKTKAERTAAGDPRPSLEERYGTHEAFVAQVRAAADKLVGERFLLKADADRIVGQAADSAVLMPSGL